MVGHGESHGVKTLETVMHFVETMCKMQALYHTKARPVLQPGAKMVNILTTYV